VTDGQVLAGRYEIGAVLGRGGMAEVRAGRDLRLGRAVAVKTLLPGLAEQPTIRRRFEGEARAAARLAHPNAVAVFDVGEEGGVPFLVMEQVNAHRHVRAIDQASPATTQPDGERGKGKGKGKD
jgi:hypothetical protein